MKPFNILCLVILLFAGSSNAQDTKPAKPEKAFKSPNGKIFPSHWGQPPLRQTRDLRPLPGGYGQGSGTLLRWIQSNLDADAKDPGRAKINQNPKDLKIKKLQEEIIKIKDFMKRARFTPEGLAKYRARLKKMENELKLLQSNKTGKTKEGHPSFDEWVKGGKKIPEGLIFTGGSPWFDESTGKNRPPEEVYKMIFGKKP